MKTTTQTACGKCNGKGSLSWTRIANGVCFQCGGSGHLVVTAEQVALMLAPRAENIAAVKKALEALLADDSVSDDFYALAWHVARSEADVEARAYAALARGTNEGYASNLRRQVETNRKGMVVKSVRRAA